MWAIGVDSDQYNLVSPELQPYILTSMLKKVDVATYNTIDAFCGGTFEGGVQVFDLASDGVGYSTSGGFVDDITDRPRRATPSRSPAAKSTSRPLRELTNHLNNSD